VGGSWVVDAGTPVYKERTQLVCQSFAARTVPIGALLGTVLDGFGFVSNFVPAGGQAVFYLRKSQGTNPTQTQICFMPQSGGGWSCAAPTVLGDGTLWRLESLEYRQGVYMLVSSSPRDGT